MISARELDLLPERAYVINACRGEVLDLGALQERLQSGRISGAALDVYDPEPPADLATIAKQRVILTPHIAGCSYESKMSIGRELYREICGFFSLPPRDR
jgi:phosphoglycerate dehydrogenase-like enzyme